jgi:NTE family protein
MIYPPDRRWTPLGARHDSVLWLENIDPKATPALAKNPRTAFWTISCARLPLRRPGLNRTWRKCLPKIMKVSVGSNHTMVQFQPGRTVDRRSDRTGIFLDGIKTIFRDGICAGKLALGPHCAIRKIAVVWPIRDSPRLPIRAGRYGPGEPLRPGEMTKGSSVARDPQVEDSTRSRRTSAQRAAHQPERRRIAIGLQGGGAHGAFTWGALDRLLEEPTLKIVGISGTSAGAMNAAIIVDGLRRGGPEQARFALRDYWEEVGRIPGLASLIDFQTFGETRQWHFDHSPLFLWLDMLTRIWSPYQTNPFNLHPLRKLLERIDFQGLRADSTAARIFICATNVRTGRRRIFSNAELSADVLLASACLPNMFQAVEIDGEAYWDGGYTGNPALNPLYLRTSATDVVIIGINPLFRDAVPQSARDIINRINEISFNSTFILELAAIAFIDDLLESNAVDSSRYKPLLIHKIEAHGALSTFGASSKMNNDPAFLHHLHQIGRTAADAWIKKNLDSVGRRSTLDLSTLLPFREDFATGFAGGTQSPHADAKAPQSLSLE